MNRRLRRAKYELKKKTVPKIKRGIIPSVNKKGKEQKQVIVGENSKQKQNTSSQKPFFF